MQSLIIPRSNYKVVKAIALIFMSVSACVWLWIDPNVKNKNPYIVRFWATVGLIFGLPVLILSVNFLFDGSPGLVIDEVGIIQHRGIFGAVRIPWNDIVGLRAQQEQRIHYLIVEVRNPASYIIRAPLWLRWLFDRRNPIKISTAMLQIDFEEMMRAMTDFRNRYGVAESPPYKAAE